MSLSPKERLGRVLRSAKDSRAPLPDRVPVMCQLSLGHCFLRSGVPPFEIWFTAEGFAEALARLAGRYRFDGILVNLPGREPDVRRRILRIERGNGGDIVYWIGGGRSCIPWDDNVRFLRPEGTSPFPRFEDVDPEKLTYIEPWDVTEIKYPWTWGFETEPRPAEDFFPPHHLDPLKAAISRAGDRLAVHSEIFSPFSQLLELLGYERGLLALVDDPGRAHACLARLADGAAELALRQAACGPDAILISSAFAGGGFISRAHYTEFVLPYERRVIERIGKRHPDLPVYTHTCGKIGDRLDLMLETGTKGVEALDPPPLGTVDLAEAKRLLRGKAFIKGNVDPVNTLLRSDRAAVLADARWRIEAAMPGGGYILSSACSVSPATPPENVEALVEAAEEFGRYGERS